MDNKICSKKFTKKKIQNDIPKSKISQEKTISYFLMKNGIH